MDQFGNITIINDDCLNVLRALPDNSFDLAIVDPPYYSGPERRSFYGSEVSTVGVPRRFYPKSRKWAVPGSEYFKELERVAKHYIVWGCNYYSHQFAPGRIVWDKCNESSSFSDCEQDATDLFASVRIFRYM